MKILNEGSPLWWIDLVLKCPRCGRSVQLEKNDEGLVCLQIGGTVGRWTCVCGTVVSFTEHEGQLVSPIKVRPHPKSNS
jgi:ribosomal protein S27AE